jgi:hypothetical protein
MPPSHCLPNTRMIAKKPITIGYPTISERGQHLDSQSKSSEACFHSPVMVKSLLEDLALYLAINHCVVVGALICRGGLGMPKPRRSCLAFWGLSPKAPQSFRYLSETVPSTLGASASDECFAGARFIAVGASPACVLHVENSCEICCPGTENPTRRCRVTLATLYRCEWAEVATAISSGMETHQRGHRARVAKHLLGLIKRMTRALRNVVQPSGRYLAASHSFRAVRFSSRDDRLLTESGDYYAELY